jgi:hypothetical protein
MSAALPVDLVAAYLHGSVPKEDAGGEGHYSDQELSFGLDLGFPTFIK